MSTQTVLPVDRQTISDLSKRNREPDWLSDLRLKGLELAEQLELPKLDKTRIDRWSLDSYGSYHTSEQVCSVQELPEEAKALFGESFTNNLIIQRNSGAVYTKISAEAASQGVIFTDLAKAVQEYPDLVRPYLNKAVEQGENRLTALHSALWNGGVFLYVPKNVHVELPFQALFIAEGSGAALSPHILIVAETNSSVRYVENVISAEGTGELVISGVAEVFAKAGAKVQYDSVNSLNSSVTNISYRRAILDQDARVEWVLGEMSNGNGLSDTTSLLKGNGSSTDTKVITVGTSNQKLDLTTRAVHTGRATSSEMTTRAVMRDEATAIVNGITIIEKGAIGASGEQTEKVLMLSPKARGDANPILLIDENDVKAGHAASVGQVNEEQVYYLMSRGISKEVAARLIIYGFLSPIVEQIPIPKLQDQLQQLVERKLGQ